MHTFILDDRIRIFYNPDFDGTLLIVDVVADQEIRLPCAGLLDFIAEGYVRPRLEKAIEGIDAGTLAMLVRMLRPTSSSGA